MLKDGCRGRATGSDLSGWWLRAEVCPIAEGVSGRGGRCGQVGAERLAWRPVRMRHELVLAISRGVRSCDCGDGLALELDLAQGEGACCEQQPGQASRSRTRGHRVRSGRGQPRHQRAHRRGSEPPARVGPKGRLTGRCAWYPRGGPTGSGRPGSTKIPGRDGAKRPAAIAWRGRGLSGRPPSAGAAPGGTWMRGSRPRGRPATTLWRLVMAPAGLPLREGAQARAGSVQACRE